MTRRWTLYPFKVEEDYNGELTLTAQPKAVEGIAAALELDQFDACETIFEKWIKRGWMHLDAFDLGYDEEGLVLSKSLTYRMPVDGNEATDEPSELVTVRVGDEHPAWYVARDLLTNWAAGGSVRFTRETALPKVENMDGSESTVDLAELRASWIEDKAEDDEAAQNASRVDWLGFQLDSIDDERAKVLDAQGMFYDMFPLRWDEPREVTDLREALESLSGDARVDEGAWDGKEWGPTNGKKAVGPDPERYPVACPACGARAGTGCSCKSRTVELWMPNARY